MRELLKGAYAWWVKKLQSIVDPVLGTLINFMGMRMINTRRVKLANKGMITVTKSNQTNGQYTVGFTIDRNETTELTQKLTDLFRKYNQDQNFLPWATETCLQNFCIQL